jgi:hypothetical protein
VKKKITKDEIKLAQNRLVKFLDGRVKDEAIGKFINLSDDYFKLVNKYKTDRFKQSSDKILEGYKNRAVKKLIKECINVLTEGLG